MHALSASKLLSVWEQCLGCSPVERALVLLAAACPDQSPEELARLSIGRRDALLLTLREQTFGPKLLSRANCHGCSEAMELSFSLAQIRTEQTASTAEVLSLKDNDYEIDFRLP